MLICLLRALTPTEIAISGLIEDKPKCMRLVEKEDGMGRGKCFSLVFRWPTIYYFIFAGVVAEEDIEKGSFVVEYKSYKTYPTSERQQHDREYATNGEGCFILEAQTPKGQWICLDATRNVDSWARFINHGHGSRANLKMQVVQVENEWRVALMAKVSIKKGRELFYDYGKQKDPPDWMKAKPILLDPYEDAAEGICTIPSTQPLFDNLTEPSTETTDAGTTTKDATAPIDLPAQSDEPENAKVQTDLASSTRAKDKLCQQCNSVTTNSILCRDCGIICQTCSGHHARMSTFSNHTVITAEELQQSIPNQSCGLCNSTPATTYCKDCTSYVCHQCVDQHARMKCFLEHKFISKTECPTRLKENTSFEDFAICFDCTNPCSVSQNRAIVFAQS